MPVRDPDTARYFDHFAIAAEAVVLGSALEGHWQTLAAVAERDGIDPVAKELARLGGARGPTQAWWRCTLLLSTDLTPGDALHATRMLIHIEEAGGGPAFDVDRHALHVSATVRWLEAHLERVRRGVASSLEQSAAEMVVHTMRVARARVRG